MLAARIDIGTARFVKMRDEFGPPAERAIDTYDQEFVGAGDVGDELDGCCLGERIQFTRANVSHLFCRHAGG
ncbi:hypothetical protein [Burkholderia gladioli]|uniref:hypothetical protein n=1 Tax=Burkholderia gladioli TaxID=28095 RepID=UPI001C5E2974|nr:hypothetical protein [Burkholderia gladioli]MBW5286754.1 hypothetical protein [Burkholderia gladioli]